MDNGRVDNGGVDNGLDILRISVAVGTFKQPDHLHKKNDNK